MILGTGSLTWSDEADCAICAGRMAACDALRDSSVSLEGPLGGGKTTFVRHLLRALGVGGRIKSPTYAVVEPHSAIDCPVMPAGEPLSIWHFDFYRFDDAREFEDAGFRDVFAHPGLKLVEWPDRAAGMLPVPDLRMTLAVGTEEQREVTVDALTPRGAALLEDA